MITVCMLGAGSWGTTIANLLAENGALVYLWCYEAEVRNVIQRHRRNDKYLPGVSLHPNIIAFESLQEAVSEVSVIFEAVPIKFFRSILIEHKNDLSNKSWIVLSKGIDQETLCLPTQLIANELESVVEVAVVAGPSFAKELARKQITAVTLACPNQNFANRVEAFLQTSYFKLYKSTDVLGAQVGGAFKNVVALLIGLLEGAGYEENAKAYILTRGLQEMIQWISYFGGKIETGYGLSGVGDLILTCTSSLSKNREFGRKIGARLESVDQAVFLGIEGFNTVQSLYKIMMTNNITSPFCKILYEILFNNSSIDELLKN